MSTTDKRLGLTALNAVRPPQAPRKLAGLLLMLILVLPPTLSMAPWQQNVPASGRVTAVDPLDRLQVIPAPVTGRLVELGVQEGVFVERGDVLARMADQDPDYAQRLEQQMELTREKLRAANEMVALYEQQRLQLELAREQAISSARAEYNVAVKEVEVARRELDGRSAELAQKQKDYERKRILRERGTVSELEFQEAEADYLSLQNKVGAARAKVEQAQEKEVAKQADVEKVASDLQAKIESIKSDREKAASEAAQATKDLNEATTRVARQNTQVITAPRAGYVQRVHAASTAELLTQGSALIELIPVADELAVELWVKGVDAPLITPGRKVRLQFEGWPAVQVAGWPSVAMGTFGGVVRFVDAHGNREGKFRVLIVPDPEDEPWPDGRYLRQGVRANGWLLLETVSLGYELWRILNAFPPALSDAPDAMPAAGTKPVQGGKGK